MLIVADENMALVRQFFGHLGTLSCVAGRQMSSQQVSAANVVLVRSVTPVNAALLAGSRVRFVGSATIGADHLDQDWLTAQGIVFTTAPGCNARSVVDYVLTALVHLSQQQAFDLSGRVLGVVGLGNVGYLLARVGQALGLRVLGCDPWVNRTDIEQVSLAQLLREADIVSLHTPLIRDGEHPTFHLLNAANLPTLQPGTILLNCGRGAVIDNQALLAFLLAQHQQGQKLEDCYLAVDDCPALQDEVLDWLAERMQLPLVPKQQVDGFSNKRLSNKHLKTLGYTFAYPGFREGYAAVV